MHGIGPPLVTPFAEDGSLDEDALRALVGWVEDRGVDFLVPCGSNSEASVAVASASAWRGALSSWGSSSSSSSA